MLKKNWVNYIPSFKRILININMKNNLESMISDNETSVANLKKS